MDQTRLSKKGAEILQEFKEKHSLRSNKVALSCLVEKYDYMQKIYSETLIQNQMLKNTLRLGLKSK